MGGSMRKAFLALLLALMCLAPHGYAQETEDHSVDGRMQRLSVLSQRDEAIGALTYHHATVQRRGCMPVSVVNGLIASFGVTDRETAVGLVQETLSLLVPRGSRGKAPVDLQSLPGLLDPALRADEREAYPNLAETVGAYPGDVCVTQARLSAREVLERLDGAQTPLMFVSRMAVHPDWTDAVELLMALHEMGLDDATLCLACAGAGTETSGAPLRSSKSGHYLTVFFHVGTFAESGAVYVLDSLPRALAGEPYAPYGQADEVHAQYPFVYDSPGCAFNQNFEAARISPTVIKLSLTQTALEALRAEPEETALAQRVRLMKPLILFGPCVMMLSLP